MNLARALAADLRDLAVDLAVDGYTRTTLAMIEHNLRRTVPSALGVSITLHTPALPCTPVVAHFVSRTVAADEVRAALVLPVRGLVPPRTGSITFYAAEPAAFTPLVADLAYALQIEPDQIEQDPPLPTAPISPGVEGLQDFSLVNRAMGVLLNHGHTLDSARTELAHRAAVTQGDLIGTARAILGAAHY